MNTLRLCFFLFLGIITHFLGAQSAFQPFRSAAVESFVSSEHFDVYYKGGNEKMAIRVAKYAEMARGELGFLYDYKPASRYIFVLLNHPYERLFHNYAFQPNDGYYAYGVIPLPKLDAEIVLPEDLSFLYNTVKYGVSSVMLKEFDYGQDLPNVIQNELLNVKPQWFYEGITDFVANGWMYQDELILQSVENADFVESALFGKDVTGKLMRKSVWFYIAHEYGPQKFAELVYLSKITHSVETATIGVLGVPLKTLTERWREFLKKHIDELNKERVNFTSLPNSERFILPKGFQTAGFSFSETTQQVAVYGQKNGQYKLFLFDIQADTYKEIGVTFGYKNNILSAENGNFPLAWRAAGKQLVYTIYNKDKWELWEYDTETEARTLAFADSAIQRISQITFSNDNKKVAFSAIQDGKSDIWIGKSDFSLLKKITDDMYDDVQPAWSYDDSQLYFCSNRDTNRLKLNVAPKWDYFRQLHDIVAYNVNAPSDTLTFITQTPYIQEKSPQNPNSFEVYFLSDESGIADLYKQNLFTKVVEPLTKTESGISNWDSGTGEAQMITEIYENGNPVLYSVSRPESGIMPVLPTTFRSEYLAMINQKYLPVEIKPETPSLTPWEGKKDSSETPLRYYIYDDNVSDNHVAKPGKNKKAEENTNIIKTHQPEWKDIVVTNGQPFRNQWRAEYLQMSVVYHALPRSGIMLGTGFHDILHHHRITASVTPYFSMLPFIQFGNADAQIKYNYQKLRPDFHVEAGGWIRQYQQEAFSAALLDSLSYRFSNLYLKGSVTYPFSTRLRGGFSQSLHFLQKQDLHLVYNTNPPADEKRQIARSTLFADFSNVVIKDDFSWKGTSIHGEINLYNALKGKSNNFQSFSISAQHYQPLWRNIVLAGNFQSVFSFGQRKQVFYLGGIDNWFLGILRRNRPGSPAYTGKLNLDVSDFAFQEFVVPVRGFWFNSRNGNKYLLTNWDLRIPFSSIFHPALNAKSLFDWEFIPFFDVGTVWRTGNPFSQKNPTDIQTIYGNPVTVQLQTLKSPFIMGFGSGLKTKLLNYTFRMDVAWGIDDNTLQKPVLTLAMGRAF